MLDDTRRCQSPLWVWPKHCSEEIHAVLTESPVDFVVQRPSCWSQVGEVGPQAFGCPSVPLIAAQSGEKKFIATGRSEDVLDLLQQLMLRLGIEH